MSINKTGKEESAKKAFDSESLDIIDTNIEKYEAAFERTKSRFADLENARKRAHLIKWHVIESLDKYLLEFEANFTARAGKVIWANDAAEAREAIWKIAESKKAKTIVKSQSMTVEEIELTPFLKSKEIELLNTEISEYILQLLVHKPDCFATQMSRQDLKDIAKLFNEKFGTPLEATAAQLTLKAKEILRTYYIKADIGITGANFLVAETGSIAITENEGNARLGTTFPKTHIAVVGIEKIIPTMRELDLFWPLLALHGTGQQLTAYNSLLTGPKQPYESDGPEEMYVILLDNGRTKLLEKEEMRQALYSIYCKGRMRVNSVGTAAYPGPIGAIISPYLYDKRNYAELSHLWPLSGDYKNIYPVDIDINRLLLLTRRDLIKENQVSPAEQKRWKWFTYLMQRRRLLDFFGGKVKNFVLRLFFKKNWGRDRELPTFTNRSFSQQWKAQQKHKE